MTLTGITDQPAVFTRPGLGTIKVTNLNGAAVVRVTNAVSDTEMRLQADGSPATIKTFVGNGDLTTTAHLVR